VKVLAKRPMEAHNAEVNAINSVKDKSLLKKSLDTLCQPGAALIGYITPPCAEFNSKKWNPVVIIGLLDPYDEVAGKGNWKN